MSFQIPLTWSIYLLFRLSIALSIVDYILLFAEYAYGSIYGYCRGGNVLLVYELEYFPIFMGLSRVSKSIHWLIANILNIHLHDIMRSVAVSLNIRLWNNILIQSV